MDMVKETFKADSGQFFEWGVFTVGPDIDGPYLVGVHNPQKTWNNFFMPFLTFDGVVELAEWAGREMSAGRMEFCGGPIITDDGRIFWDNTLDGSGGVELLPTYFDDKYGDEPFFDVGSFGWAFEIWGAK